MKKTLTVCTAILLAAAMTGCGKQDNSSKTSNNSAMSKIEETQKPENQEPVIIDPFEKIKYTIIDPENSIYPDNIQILFDESEAELGDKVPFTYYVRADSTGLKIKIEADTSKIEGFLNDTKYEASRTEAIYAFDIKEMPTRFMNMEQLNDDNKRILIDSLLPIFEKAINENEAYSEFKNYRASSYTLENVYAIFQNEDTPLEASVSEYETEDEFGKVTIEHQKHLCSVQNPNKVQIYAIFKGDDNDKYYSANFYDFKFMPGKAEGEPVKIDVSNAICRLDAPASATYHSAQEAYVNRTALLKDDIIEIPLD